MRRGARVRFAAVGFAAAVASGALAYSCPILIKEADELIAKAQVAVTKSASPDKPQAEQALAEARRLVAEARKDHEGAKAKAHHATAVRKLRTAKAFAEEALVLSQP